MTGRGPKQYRHEVSQRRSRPPRDSISLPFSHFPRSSGPTAWTARYSETANDESHPTRRPRAQHPHPPFPSGAGHTFFQNEPNKWLQNQAIHYGSEPGPNPSEPNTDPARTQPNPTRTRANPGRTRRAISFCRAAPLPPAALSTASAASPVCPTRAPLPGRSSMSESLRPNRRWPSIRSVPYLRLRPGLR